MSMAGELYEYGVHAIMRLSSLPLNFKCKLSLFL